MIAILQKGNFKRLATFLALTVAILGSFSSSCASTFDTVYSFNRGTDGLDPIAGVISDSHGALYGTTSVGGFNGSADCSLFGCGTIFRLNPPATSGGGWTKTVLHYFNFADGNQPSASLLMGPGRVLYGTTPLGGAGTNPCGVVFALIPPTAAGGSWTEQVIHYFACGTNDGHSPYSSLVMTKNGTIFGTTAGGGKWDNGTVFALRQDSASAWREIILYSFGPFGGDNNGPFAGLLTIGDALFGTTESGGAVGFNDGTVFALASPGTRGEPWTETVLHSFIGGLTNNTDGGVPTAGALIVGQGGLLYGTTEAGGVSDLGTVFSLLPPTSGSAWTETVIYSFVDETDGFFPLAGLLAGKDGSLYGTTYAGGPNLQGTIFQLTPPATSGEGWSKTILHSFAGGSDGRTPAAGLVMGLNGAWYGTTADTGPPSGNGTVFEVIP